MRKNYSLGVGSSTGGIAYVYIIIRTGCLNKLNEFVILPVKVLFACFFDFTNEDLILIVLLGRVKKNDLLEVRKVFFNGPYIFNMVSGNNNVTCPGVIKPELKVCTFFQKDGEGYADCPGM